MKKELEKKKVIRKEIMSKSYNKYWIMRRKKKEGRIRSQFKRINILQWGRQTKEKELYGSVLILKYWKWFFLKFYPRFEMSGYITDRCKKIMEWNKNIKK